eukprot:CAMPEP_0185924020 /NCGR_PEP_ID=MMETSP0924C-20121207/11882_1 /TAXON_ID=321610 /ORGANISM="Perkinsus chesapeaki, Strain ATCC PRA-65" /LENGTH=31 /DNA_ID= /DNA_START= /DNA_END= /DNA_ORIENTATION=
MENEEDEKGVQGKAIGNSAPEVATFNEVPDG